MGVEGAADGWRKAIPAGRDRWQSRVLVWVGVPVLCYLTISTTWLVSRNSGHFIGHFIGSLGRYDDGVVMAVAVSLFFGLVAWRVKAATPLAAACGGMICLSITEYSMRLSVVRSGLTPLILLFVLTFEATRLSRGKKAIAELDEDRKGRNATQVIANLGIAALFCSLWNYPLLYHLGGFWGEWMGDNPGPYFALMYLPMLAALAEATADTISSEIGQAFGGMPFLLTTLRRVPAGTDGAVSVYGTLAGIAGAAIIAAIGALALGMTFAECAVAFAAGVAGLFFDSLLGATVERKGWIGNDLVNFFSTAFAAGVSLAAIRFMQDALLR